MLLDDPGFRLACEEHELTLSSGPRPAPAMWPAAGAPSSWEVPAIATPGALAERLGIEVGTLEWLADCQARERQTRAGVGRRYEYRWMAKPSGSARLIEVPRPFLKAIQRRVLGEVIGAIPPHDAAHAFRPGRSVRTFVAPHVGRRVVLKLDLRDFFPTITAARVTALFLTAGYPEPVAFLLAGLCTNSAPRDVLADPACPDPWRARHLLGRPHLPQGAPSSPALANLSSFRLDVRLAGLAATADAHYTRYADDLAFSGGPVFERSIARFQIHACAIALEEGFEIHTHKTRVMRRGVRQRIAGVVLNDRPNIARDEYDALKATLHNCVRLGPACQNRANHPNFRAHLTGRVAHTTSINPERGRRLQALLNRIVW
jgi:hypothetical protein